MASVRSTGDRVRVELDEGEASLLVSLVSQTITLLDPDGIETVESPGADPLERLLATSSAPVATPEDPAVRRLLPAAYRDDDEAAGEFRRLTDSDLRMTKATALRRVVADVSGSGSGAAPARLELDEEAATAWLHALADVRLALGTRLNVTEDLDRELEELAGDDDRRAGLAFYDWLSWLQDAIVRAVSGD